ncbi:MAG: hypothetical protein LBQ11_00220 [Candidatus Nomurabacteria bacterium]|nr:hypothetical protein [Candidatus Nomurabacteria bacterium]
MKKFSFAIIVAVFVAAGFGVSRALSVPDVATITTNCTAAQSILNQIQKADTGSRINRGHDYNEILNLMFAMNARLAVNKIAASTLTDLASQFGQNLAEFRTNYSNYSDNLSSVLSIKCTDRPIEFYNKLEITRVAREVLKQDVEILGQNINDYYDEFNTVMKESRR